MGRYVPTSIDRFLSEVRREFAHAREKHPGEEGVLTDAEWLAVLTEEVGECARALQDEGDDELRRELAQVAAMALRWWLSIPLGRQRPPWAMRDAGAECRSLSPDEPGPGCGCRPETCALGLTRCG